MIKVLIVIWCAFAWAIGGEHFFGKWKRGFLLLPAFCLAGAMSGVNLWYYPIQIFFAWGSYQALTYDDPIRWAFGIYRAWWERLIGYYGLEMNGLIIGLAPGIYWFFRGELQKVWISFAICMIAFMLICVGSNVLKWSIPICWRITGNNGKPMWDPDYQTWYISFFCPNDSWWLSCFIFGAVLGGCFLL